MIKRKYTIEATTKSLALFLGRVAGESDISETLVNRVSTNSTEEYHYVVLTAPTKVHEKLRRGYRYESKGVL